MNKQLIISRHFAESARPIFKDRAELEDFCEEFQWKVKPELQK